MDHFINKLIRSLVDYNYKDFFYVRLLEGAPVIKLRVRIHKLDSKKVIKLKKIIIDVVNNSEVKIEIQREEYFTKYRRDLSTNTWQEHGKIIFEDYIPEIKRYGGQKNIPLIEENFIISSNLIGLHLKELGNMSRKIKFSMILNKYLFELLPFKSNSDYKLFFNHASDIWTAYVEEHQTNFYREDIGLLGKSLLNKIKQTNLKKDYTVGFNTYFKNIKLISKLKLVNYNEENPQFTNGFKDFLNNQELDTNLVNVILSLVHMNNNRLGIFPFLEAIIYKMYFLNGRI